MLSQYLKDAISDIETLIKLTNQDIEDIKNIRHEEVFSRTKIKNDLVVSFEAKKALLDNELVLLLKSNEGSELADILSEEDNENLSQFKNALMELHSANKIYAKYVIMISEFYNSALESIFPSEQDGYKRSSTKPATFLKVSV